MPDQKNHPRKEDLLLTGPYHPLGVGHCVIPLNHEQRSSQGLRAQLVKLPSRWAYVVPELQIAESEDLAFWKAQVEYIETRRALQIARENGQEALFYLITKLDSSV